MANIGYYAHEVTSMLAQTEVNRDNIGMDRVNVLELPDGDLSPSTSADAFSVESSSEQGTITVTVVDDIPDQPDIEYRLAELTLTGKEQSSTGKIMPGTYMAYLSQVISEGFENLVECSVRVRVKPSAEGYSTFDTYWFSEEGTMLSIPENVELVLVDLIVRSEQGQAWHEHCELSPMLAISAHKDLPFEPYKPDLQTQINNISENTHVVMNEMKKCTAQVTALDSTVGTVHINTLSVPEGDLTRRVIDPDSSVSPFPMNEDFSYEGVRQTGQIKVKVNKTTHSSDVSQDIILTPLGDAEEVPGRTRSAGRLKSGNYILSLLGEQIEGLKVSMNISVNREGETVDFGYADELRSCTITVPDDYTDVAISVHTYCEHDIDPCELVFSPYMRLTVHESVPFEPYKPSLQEQVDSISGSVAAELLQLTDTLCIKRSTNLFPAKFVERTELEHPIGTYVMFKTLESYVDAVCFVGKQGTDAGTDILEFFINVYPSTSKAKDTIKRCTSLLPGTYVLSFEQDTELDYWDTAAGYATMEVHEDPQSGRMWTDDPATMIAETSGENVEFTVGDKPLAITIKMHRNEGMSWYQNGIVILPFLRRKENINAPRDSFVPSVEEQLKELYALSGAGGYNEIQTNALTDEVREEEI